MIKLLIFDIDGVLVRSKKLHETCFILALRHYGYNLTGERHRQEFDGLPTKEKLDRMGIPENLRKNIFDLKQKLTFEKAKDFISYNPDIKAIFSEMHNDYKIAVASNAIRDFCELILDILEIRPYVDRLLTNEDVSEPKPSPMMYNEIINHFGVNQSDVVIFEDSKFGLKAAFSSGANVYHVENPSYLNIHDIKTFIEVYK